MRLSAEYLTSLESMASSYQQAMNQEVADYLYSRGIGSSVIANYRLGVVDESHPEHARYAGMICIPYITSLAGVVSLKFRQPHECGDDCTHAKYISPYETRIYNPLALDGADLLGYVAITEGEIDAMTLDYFCGIPAIGIPGVETWKHHPEWRELFRGFRRVLVFPDNDEINPVTGERPGAELAARIAHDIDTAKVLRLPAADVNKTYLEYGPDEIRRIASV